MKEKQILDDFRPFFWDVNIRNIHLNNFFCLLIKKSLIPDHSVGNKHFRHRFTFGIIKKGKAFHDTIVINIYICQFFRN